MTIECMGNTRTGLTPLPGLRACLVAKVAWPKVLCNLLWVGRTDWVVCSWLSWLEFWGFLLWSAGSLDCQWSFHLWTLFYLSTASLLVSICVVSALQSLFICWNWLLFFLCPCHGPEIVWWQARRCLADYIDVHRKEARKSVTTQMEGTSITLHPEYLLTYLVHVLAHHPGFPVTSSEHAHPLADDYFFRLVFLLWECDNWDIFCGFPNGYCLIFMLVVHVPMRLVDEQIENLCMAGNCSLSSGPLFIKKRGELRGGKKRIWIICQQSWQFYVALKMLKIWWTTPKLMYAVFLIS